MPSNTIVFIHGAFVTQRSWDPWVARFQAQGFRALAIPWPDRDKPVQALRQAHPDQKLGELSLKRVLDHYVDALQKLDEKPVLIGHSLGGLLTQLLLQRDLAVAGVAIDSVPPQGVLPKQWSFYRASFPLINPLFPATAPYYMSFGEFQYAFVNGLSLAEQQIAYDTHAVPESRQVARQGLTDVAKIDFTKAHPPLLFIAGEKDHFIPSPLNWDNYKAYRASMASASVTDFKEFPGRNHYIIGQKGWEQVADYALGWLRQRRVVADGAGMPVMALAA